MVSKGWEPTVLTRPKDCKHAKAAVGQWSGGWGLICGDCNSFVLLTGPDKEIYRPLHSDPKGLPTEGR